MVSFYEQRNQLCKICQLLFSRGLVSGSDGNISMRLNFENMLITPSGICKGLLEPEQLLVQDFDSNVLEGTLRSTKEAFLHIAYYTARPQICAVIHTHPPFATSFAASGREIPLDVVIELPVLIGKTPVADYARPGSAALVNTVKEHIESDTLLLKNHGVITVGKDLTEAFVKMDALENAAKTIILAELSGGIKRIPEDEVAAMLK